MIHPHSTARKRRERERTPKRQLLLAGKAHFCNFLYSKYGIVMYIYEKGSFRPKFRGLGNDI